MRNGHNDHMQRGQALVIVLLILAVALTVGLSIISRTVTEVNVSTSEEESARALAAAESGIEQALSSGTGGSANVGTTGSYVATATNTGSGSEAVFPELVKAGEVLAVFLAPFDTQGQMQSGSGYNGGSVHICWGNAGTAAGNDSTPAMEAVLYYKQGVNYGVGRAGVDPNTTRRGENNFLVDGGGTCPTGTTFAFSKNLTLVGNFGMPPGAQPLLLKLRLLYNGDVGHTLGVRSAGSASFPDQAQLLDSGGQAGSTQRKVQVINRLPEWWSLFESAVVSGGNL